MNTEKLSQYKIERVGNGYGIVGRFTSRWITNINRPLTKREAETALAELEKYTHDTEQSFKGFYGG